MQATHSLLTLRIFVGAARSLSLSRTAETMHLTQSAVSKHIKALEARLRITLFTRHARGIQLTEAGRAYLEGIEPALAAIDDTEARLAERLRQGNRIALAVPPAVAGWVAPAVAAFMRRHPDISVVMRPRPPSSHRADGMGSPAAPDAEIRFGQGSWAGMQSRYLLGRETCLVGSPGLVQQFRLMAPADLVRRPAPLLRHLLVPQAWPTWLAAMGLPSDTPNAAATSEYEQYSTLLAAALAGLGLAVVPRFLAAEHLRAGTLVAPFGEVVRLEAGYHLVIPDALRHSAPLRLFADHLAREAARIGRAADWTRTGKAAPA